MKIVHLYPHILRTHGATKWLLLFISQLEERGTRNTILCTKFAIPKPYWFKGTIQPVFSASKSRQEKSGIRKLISIFFQLIAMFFLPLRIPRDTDVIVCHAEESSLSIALARLIFREQRLIYYCYQIPRELYNLKDYTLHTYGVWFTLLQPLFFVFKYTHRYLIRLVKDIMVWSPQAAEEAKIIYGSLNYHIVPAGVDLTRYQTSPEVGQWIDRRKKELGLLHQKVFLMNASLIKRKNIPIFFDLIKRCIDERYFIHALIIGEGPEKASLEQQLVFLNIQSAVTFLGYVTEEELPGYYYLCDILYFLELNGIWTMSIIEAGAAGKPVIAAKGGSMPTLVDHGKTGFIVQDLKEDLFKCTKMLLDSERLCAEMGERNYNWAQQFSVSKSVERFLAVVENE